MSFGFGFALPAYPLRGGGGNNPFNQLGPTLDLSFVDGATNVGNQLGADTYTLNTDFITPEYQVAAQYAVWVAGSGLTQRNFADIVTFTRGTAATQFDSTGTLIFAPMNAIRNNMMVGAVAGTPGTPPTNWGVTTTGGSITRTIVGTGTENGITYIDIRYVFTGAATAFVIPQTATEVAALTGQTWTASSYAKLVAGSLTNLTAQIALDEYSSVPAFLVGSSTPFVPTGAALSTQRFGHTRALNNASTAFVVSSVQLIASGAADITLRIGLPQLERGSVATAVNETSGTAYYGPRFDFNPSTLAAQGLLIEEQRTNSIRNNTMQGAVAGTPGTLPTNWAIGGVTTGLTISVVGTGTESGITYIDIRFNGTAGAALNPNILFDTSTGIAAANGQTWAWSSYVSLVGGSLTNVTNIIAVQSMFSSIPTLLGTLSGSPFVPTGAALNTQRQTFVGTLNQATTAFVRPQLQFSVANGAAIDITLRIGLPQLELGAFATSVIPTTTTALTRSADQASVNTLSPWYNQTEGTVYAELQSLSPLTAVQSVALGKYPNVWNIESGANDSVTFWYGIGAELILNGTYNNIGTVPSGINKFAVSLAASGGQSRSSLNGAVAVNRNGTLSGTATLFSLGKDSTNNINNFLNGYLRRLTYYPRALSAAELQTITA